MSTWVTCAFDNKAAATIIIVIPCYFLPFNLLLVVKLHVIVDFGLIAMHESNYL